MMNMYSFQRLLVFPWSLCANRAIKFLFRVYYRLVFIIRGGKPVSAEIGWQTLNELLREKPGLVYYLALTAPRWNTHALIASIGALKISKSISVDIELLKKSDGLGYIVVYSSPSGATVAVLSNDRCTNDVISSGYLELEPGVYTITYRLYSSAQKYMLPGMTIDENRFIIPAREISVESQPALEKLIFHRDSILFRFLHHYMYTMLRIGGIFPERWVRREYLPVGNPETQFVYGVFRSGEALSISIEPKLLDQSSIFVTCYNKSSFPVYQRQVSRVNSQTHRFDEDGFFLFRVVGGVSDGFNPERVKVLVA